MKMGARMLLKMIFIVTIIAIVFSYAMFQGGFVSWFLFYSVIVVVLLSLSTLIVPLSRMKLSRTIINKDTVFSGDDLLVEIELKHRFFHPFCYIKVVDLVPPSLRDYTTKGTGALYFLIFGKKDTFSYVLQKVPRGHYVFSNIEVEIGDFFGFFERKKIFSIDEEVIVYPKYRELSDWQVGSRGEAEKKHSFKQAIETDLSIAGVRNYIQGDKLSIIDWKHTARQNELMSKQFSEAEENVSLLLFNPYVELKRKETFEQQVELATSLVYDYYINKRTLAFLNLSSDMKFIEKSTDLNGFQEMYRFLACVEPTNKSFTFPEQKISTNEFRTWIVLTSILSNSFVDWLIQHVERAETVIICWICETPTNVELENRRHLRGNNVRVYTFMSNDFLQE